MSSNPISSTFSQINLFRTSAARVAVTEDVDYNIMYPSGYLLKDEFCSYAFTSEDYIKVLKLGMKLGQLGYNDITVKNIKERYDM